MKTMDLFSVEDQRVLIVGGTAGIGAGVAEHFVNSGARVVIAGRRSSGVVIAQQLGAEFVCMDLADNQSVVEATSAAAALLGGIDTLILNAGVGGAVSPCETLDLENLQRVFQINLFGIAAALKAGLSYMTSGSVIVTSSPAGSHFMPEVAAYNASKAALNALVKTAALELGSKGIRVNAILPGVVESELSFDSSVEENSDELQTISMLTVNGKVRKPAELAPVFQFLASPASVTVTGALLAADDGMTAGYSPLLIGKAFYP